MSVSMRSLDGDAWPALLPVLAQSFNAPEPGWGLFRARVGEDRFRVAHEGDRVVGGYAVYALGQRWWGRDVPLGGVAGVGVVPDARGRGVAKAMMLDALRWMRESGVPVVGLYPASWQVYRSVGYEAAGERVQFEVPAAALSAYRAEVVVTPIDPVDPAGRAALRARYQPVHGNLIRSEAIWARLTHPYVGRRYAWLLGDHGYVVLGHTPPEGPHWDLDVVDLAAPDAPTARTLLGLLGGHRSMVRQVRWWGTPADTLVTHLREPVANVARQERWMLRVVDLPAALEARGWPPGVSGELHVHVEDELIPEQAGPWVVHLVAGRARVLRGGRGELRLTARAMGPLYSGYLSASALAAAELLAGPPEVLAVADRWFAAPTPWMREMY